MTLNYVCRPTFSEIIRGLHNVPNYRLFIEWIHVSTEIYTYNFQRKTLREKKQLMKVFQPIRRNVTWWIFMRRGRGTVNTVSMTREWVSAERRREQCGVIHYLCFLRLSEEIHFYFADRAVCWCPTGEITKEWMQRYV